MIRSTLWWIATARVHDMDNLYVVDGSVHVNNGGFNPSLTIQAIAYWASARMVKDLKT